MDMFERTRKIIDDEKINKLKNTKQELENSLKEKNIEFQETEYEDFLILERNTYQIRMQACK